MKKIISTLLLICMVASIGCLSAFAAEPEFDTPKVSGMSTTLAAANYTIYINDTKYTVPTDTYVGYNHTETGTYVKTAQRALNRVNSLYDSADCSAGTVDGIFGDNTEQATRNFQSWAGYTSDGVIGPTTWGGFVICCN